MSERVKITALVPAAGLGARMNLDLAKPLLEIKRKPIIIYTLETLHAHPLIDEIVLIFNKEALEKARAMVKAYRLTKVARVIAGGTTRKESVRNGLEVVDSKTGFVLIHDGVRPFVDEGSVTRVIEEAKETGAAVLGVPVKPTIKEVDGQLMVERTLKRDHLWEIQTPQVFERELIQKAYLRQSKYAVSDDASLVELMGKKVKVVMGSYFNIKITTQEDLVFAEAIASIRAME
jgi:2-C-methyl-D-erythritol 4-phosphate cytidylyltransferase